MDLKKGEDLTGFAVWRCRFDEFRIVLFGWFRTDSTQIFLHGFYAENLREISQAAKYLKHGILAAIGI